MTEQTLSEKLQTARTRHGAARVAVGAGISVSSLQDYISGKMPTQADKKKSIAKYLKEQGL